MQLLANFKKFLEGDSEPPFPFKLSRMRKNRRNKIVIFYAEERRKIVKSPAQLCIWELGNKYRVTIEVLVEFY